jgi:hypothetical protein
MQNTCPWSEPPNELDLQRDGVVLRLPRDDAATVEEALVVFACEDGLSAALSRAVAARPSDA